MKNLTFGGLSWGCFEGLQKLTQLENMIPNIMEGCLWQKKTFVRYLFEVTLHSTVYTNSGGLRSRSIVRSIVVEIAQGSSVHEKHLYLFT